MVSAVELYVLGMALVLVAALAAAVPVLLGILRDGRDRLREGASEPPAEGRDGTPPDPATGRRRCPNCGTENDAAFRYCRECAGQL
ncbi:DUF7577 domain-containing protein [Haloarcula litorea]|uniref:DUF7577 domain-containing protein n=1 Tax=Haloarcula litorea TaxID=3032579 RepID=UPI0023E85396|nr:hypothetical protein [Halomicroarcula sp. GDY20]